jgi:CheY-like chemotaxis protein
MAEMLSVTLDAYGYSTLFSHSGRKALDNIYRERLDLVLLNLMMPDLDGFETLTRLRAIPHARNLPVIMLTARDEDDLEQKSKIAGVTDLLRKPIDPGTLVELISSCLNHR